MNKKIILIIVNVLLLGFNIFVFSHKTPILSQPSIKSVDPIKQPPIVYKTDFISPSKDMTFAEIDKQLQKWASECKEIVTYGTYGKTQSGRAIPYLRIGNKTGPKVLIGSCIHGNEHLSAMVTMGVVGNILNNYPEWKELLATRDIYYIPVICPDSYERVSREDMRTDPNRNFTDRNLGEIKSIPAIQSLKEFHLQNSFKAFMSCHNYGEVYLFPWGYAQKPTESDSSYKRILSKMASVSGYKYEQLLRQSAGPFFGYEVDWFYKHGAFSIVNEIGKHFQPSKSEIDKEVEINLKAIRIFIEEAPLVRN